MPSLHAQSTSPQPLSAIYESYSSLISRLHGDEKTLYFGPLPEAMRPAISAARASLPGTGAHSFDAARRPDHHLQTHEAQRAVRGGSPGPSSLSQTSHDSTVNSSSSTQIRTSISILGAPSIFVGLIFCFHSSTTPKTKAPKCITGDNDSRDPLVILYFFYLSLLSR